MCLRETKVVFAVAGFRPPDGHLEGVRGNSAAHRRDGGRQGERLLPRQVAVDRR